MEFEIIWSDSAVRQLRKLERVVAKRIFEKVGELSSDPFRNVKRIVNSPYFRLRVVDYRVILDIQAKVLRVLVLKIGQKGSVYGRSH